MYVVSVTALCLSVCGIHLLICVCVELKLTCICLSTLGMGLQLSF